MIFARLTRTAATTMRSISAIQPRCIASPISVFSPTARHGAPFSSTLPTTLRGISTSKTTTTTCAIRNISAQEASELSNAGQVYLDVRTEQEFCGGCAPSAVNIPVLVAANGGMAPNPDFIAKVEATFPDKSETLLVACQAGKRSEMAVQILENAGYQSLCNVEGGFMAWVQAGLPVTKQ